MMPSCIIECLGKNPKPKPLATIPSTQFSIALVDGFASCAVCVGNLVDHVADVDHIAKFTESPLDVLFPGQIAYPDGVLFRQSVPFG
jgi:hypothetical protein